jgi:hypothetical protein
VVARRDTSRSNRIPITAVGSYTVPPDTPPDKAETAFERLADLIVSYLSSRFHMRQTLLVGQGVCITCGKDDCFATAEPWAARLIYLDGEAYVLGGLCWERPWAKRVTKDAAPIRWSRNSPF